MDITAIINIIVTSLKDVISEQAEEFPLDNVNQTTQLFGPGSFLDSLTLVSLIVDVEQKLAEEYGINVALADERAMSLEKSPFRTIGTLADYIQLLLRERRQNG